MSTPVVLRAHNAPEALRMGVSHIMREGITENTRAGPCLVAPGPVVTTTVDPTQRVVFSATRDANPFFHLAETMWMLAGRQDAALLNNFIGDFGERFAEGVEAGGVIHGAYGHRWRSVLGFDQLAAVIERLRRDRTTRQCVIQMWDARPETAVDEFSEEPASGVSRGCDDLRGEWRDRPCNTHAYLRVREEAIRHYDSSSGVRTLDEKFGAHDVLDLTVCCRSNDLIWGAHGANAVHFSFLLEYLAAMIGVGVGLMHQVSNNYHAYEAEIHRLYERAKKLGSPLLVDAMSDDRYRHGEVSAEPLVENPQTFDAEVEFLLTAYEEIVAGGLRGAPAVGVRNKFLRETLWPAMLAHRAHKEKRPLDADAWLSVISASDWRVACTEWVTRRRRP